MPLIRSLLPLLLLASSAVAADPVSITLLPKPAGTDGVVSIGQAVKLSGGTAATREKMAKLDLIERSDVESISRKLIRYRLRLAGYAEADFTFNDGVANGALLSAESVEEAAKQELIRRLGTAPDEVFVDVVKPVVVKLPAVTASDTVELTATPVGGTVKLGRTQVDVTIKVNGERKLTLPVFLQAAAATGKGEKGSDEAVVKAKQRVLLTARIGDLKVSTAGVAVESGKVGQTIKVENLDSKKVVTGTVVGPAAVEIDLGESK